MDSTLVIKSSYTYCKNLLVIKTKYYMHAPRGIDWQEKTIARPRPPLIRKTIKEHLMLQICHTTITIHACYGTCKPQHKYFSFSQLLNQHTLILPPLYLKIIVKYQTSPSTQCTFYESFYYTILDAYHIRTKFITKENYHAVLKNSQNNVSEA